MFLLFCRLSLFLLLLPAPVFCAEQQDNRARLQEIRQRIEQTNKSLQVQQQQELSLLRDLALINTSLQEVDRRIRGLQQEQKRGKKKIKKVRAGIEQGRRDLQKQQLKLKKRLVSLYKEGNTGILKVLFSSNTPMELAEQYEYLSRILENDKAMMADFRSVIKQQQSRLTDLESLQRQQQRHLNDEKSEREDARSARQLQAQLLSKVRLDKSQLHAELQKLKENAGRLEELVKKLNIKKGSAGGNFAALKGKLPWPLKGALLVGFGTQKNRELGTLYESHGIEIAAAKGAKLRAVASGKVVFASWFKGYGNLLIVSHAGGYHTLYAQAESLRKEVGERVEAGEPVAVAGSTGKRGIYFEVRQQGAPANPLSWLQSR
jgi:septal ring factor EnvC (AmiA/AmiB activator)